MGKLLVLEDELPVRLFLNEALRMAGHQVCTVANGMEGLRQFLDGESFDLILSDVQMPQMSGLRFVERVREMGVVIPILMLTASPEMVIELWEKGSIQGVLRKPVDLSELLDEVKLALGLTLDRRNTPRMAWTVPVTLTSDSGVELSGLIADISAGGVRINWDQPIDREALAGLKRLIVDDPRLDDLQLSIQAMHSLNEPQTGFTFELKTRDDVAQLGRLLSHIS